MNESLKNGILNFAHDVVTVLSRIIPKKDNSLMIYGFRQFDDNSRALFQYLVKEQYNIKYSIFCTAKDIAEFREKKWNNVTFSNNLVRILWAHVRSQYIFYSIATVFTCTPGPRQTIVNMWHGTVLKRLGYMDNEKQWRDLSSMFSYICCASDFFKPVMMKCFGCDASKIIINGQPRCDIMLNPNNNLEKLLPKQFYKKIIVWMPTYRNDGRGRNDSITDFPILSEENIDILNQYLIKVGVLLIIKPHQLQISIPIFSQERSNILILSNADLYSKEIELYELLGQSDALITDYSSVFFDYLLLDRPIGFTIDDIHSYQERRGFTVDNYEQLMAGQKISNIYELELFIDNVIQGKDDYSEARQMANALSNERKSGFSKYLLDKIGIVK